MDPVTLAVMGSRAAMCNRKQTLAPRFRRPIVTGGGDSALADGSLKNISPSHLIIAVISDLYGQPGYCLSFLYAPFSVCSMINGQCRMLE